MQIFLKRNLKRFEKLFWIVITRPVSRRSGDIAGGKGAGRLLNHRTNSNTPLTVSIPIPISQNPLPQSSLYPHIDMSSKGFLNGHVGAPGRERRIAAASRWLWQSEVARVKPVANFQGSSQKYLLSVVPSIPGGHVGACMGMSPSQAPAAAPLGSD